MNDGDLISRKALLKKATMHGHCVRPMVTAYHMCVDIKDIEKAPAVDAVELPCKIGDVVYIENGDDETPHFVDPGEVFAIGIDENEIMWISARYESGLKYYHTADDIGKTVFLTREAAEAAINKKEKENEVN